ncbi:hypothetical protein [Natronomonas sp. LN261]|uniref:hypothetical protein n=1 Tax=Natronomonas sp. LN261 TaxID=2750669 RepID=UPI0015EF6108|nr:hypothetical protein [Natronomonas sp. LN261]
MTADPRSRTFLSTPCPEQSAGALGSTEAPIGTLGSTEAPTGTLGSTEAPIGTLGPGKR